MIFQDVQAIVLAAGKATRFKTNTSKLVEKLCGQEMILFITKALEDLQIHTIIIVGHQKEAVMEVLKKHHSSNIDFVTQEKQEGTGHAVLCSKSTWHKDLILIMNGDMPLVTETIIEQLYNKHKETNATITLAIAHDTDPSGAYGRIVQNGNKLAIIEAKEFTADIEDHPFINAGIYLINRQFLESVIDLLARNKISNEFYITDLIKMASDKGEPISTLTVPFDRIRGINTFREFWAAEQILRSEIINHLMIEGVRFQLPQTNHIDLYVSVGAGTQIDAGVQLLGTTQIGNYCKIQSFSYLYNCQVESNVIIRPHSVLDTSHIKSNASIGPFAHIRNNTLIDEYVTLGNFVEVKQSTIGKRSKAKHLSYIGDTTIGEDVNIGAGTVTCNYDGINKHNTTIKDNAFIGSNNTLIAPVTIEKGAYTAAGSVITENVPAESLAIARTKQINKEGYAKKLRSRIQKAKNSENKIE